MASTTRQLLEPRSKQQVTDAWVQNIAVTPDGNIFAIGGDNAVYVHGSKK